MLCACCGGPRGIVSRVRGLQDLVWDLARRDALLNFLARDRHSLLVIFKHASGVISRSGRAVGNVEEQVEAQTSVQRHHDDFQHELGRIEDWLSVKNVVVDGRAWIEKSVSANDGARGEDGGNEHDQGGLDPQAACAKLFRLGTGDGARDEDGDEGKGAQEDIIRSSELEHALGASQAGRVVGGEEEHDK